MSGLAAILGDTAVTVITAARLQQGMCRAYVSRTGGLSYSNIGEYASAAVLVFDAFCPEEPIGFGMDADALWTLLKRQQGWSCVNVNAECAEALGKRIAAETGQTIRYYGDVCHALLEPVRAYSNETVRLLTAADVSLLSHAPEEVQGNGYKTAMDMVTKGIAAAAIIEGKIVAIAHIYAETPYMPTSAFRPWRRGAAKGLPPPLHPSSPNASKRRVKSRLGVVVRITSRRCGLHKNWVSRKLLGASMSSQIPPACKNRCL